MPNSARSRLWGSASRSGLRAELERVRELFPNVDTINIPDLTRFSTRSWEGCAFAPAPLRAIPHVRAIDLNPREPLPMTGAFLAHGIQEVLVVTGDALPGELVVAEIELGHAEEAFERPAWLGVEVTDVPRYYNLALASHPFVRWGLEQRGG